MNFTIYRIGSWVIDETGIHFKMLNKSKGPAVWAPRAQADKKAYQLKMKEMLENQRGLTIIQDIVEKIIIDGNIAKGVFTERGQEHFGKAVILCTGTFLKGLIHIGEYNQKAGRLGDFLELLKSTARQVRKEKGCLRYVPTVDIVSGLPPQMLRSPPRTPSTAP